MHADPWDFAVEVADLRATGLTTTDLRWLTLKAYVHHAVERTKPTHKRRFFGAQDPAVITARSAFVLTAAGADTARQALPQSRSVRRVVPFFNPNLHQLWFQKFLVKWFRQPAPEQEAILRRFQQQKWKQPIISPLSANNYEEDPRLRLHHAVERLNRHQINQLIIFFRDGTGEGIGWQTVQDARERRP